MNKLSFSIKLELLANFIDGIFVAMFKRGDEFCYSAYSKRYHVKILDLIWVKLLIFLYVCMLFIRKLVLKLLDIFPAQLILRFLLSLLAIKMYFKDKKWQK